MDELRLIYFSKQGDAQALEELIDIYYEDIYRYCYRRCFGQKELAEEVTQEVFLRLVEHIRDYHFTGKFRNYLLTIAVNLCTNTMSKKQFATTPLETQPLASDSEKLPLETLLDHEGRLLVKQSIDELPDIQKDVILLRYYHELKLKDIARIMNIPLSTVKSRLKQGQDKLKSVIQEEYL